MEIKLSGIPSFTKYIKDAEWHSNGLRRLMAEYDYAIEQARKRNQKFITWTGEGY